MVSDLAKAENDRRAMLAALPPEERAKEEGSFQAAIVEETRVLNLSPVEREAEMLVKRQAQLIEETKKVNADLARPNIVAAVAALAVEPLEEK